jgi:DNA-binding NarL/FixJ family response regulator
VINYLTVDAAPHTAHGAQVYWHKLTTREVQIALLVAAGKQNKQVASELSLSRYTVESHLKNIYGKLQIQSRTELTNVVRDVRESPPAVETRL